MSELNDIELRDKFAMHAMTSVFNSQDWGLDFRFDVDNEKSLPENGAILAYKIADAMMVARKIGGVK